MVERLNPGSLAVMSSLNRDDKFSVVGVIERVKKGYCNVIFDLYAPIKYSPVLNMSKAKKYSSFFIRMK